MNPEVISVSQFITIMNTVLTEAFPQVVIEGEVSGFKAWQGRLAFFEIKDASASLSCMMPLAYLRTPVEDGMDVRISGTPKLTDKGKFSLTVRSLELTGEGAIRRAYELLKAKLAGEGLFAAERKRPLPSFPERIGLITAPASAAYADFMKIINARWQGVSIEVAPVQVQGKVAPEQIVAAFDSFNQSAQPVDLIVLIRGGGSLEDLQAFNAEMVVRAVAGSRSPTIVGVGHEIDTSLSDLAADLRAATPTDAAVKAVPDRREITAQLAATALGLRQALQNHVDVAGRSVDLYSRHLDERIHSAIRDSLGRVSVAQARLKRIFHQLHIGLVTGSERTDQLERRIEAMSRARLAAYGETMRRYESLLRAVDPKAVLKRGYSITRLNGAILRDAATAEIGATVVIELAKNELTAAVTEVHYDRI